MSVQRPRSPGWMYGAVMVILLVLLSVFAMTQRQPPPPTIAEFAPQSVDTIDDAPSDQSSSSGRGAGHGVSDAAPEPTPTPAEVVSVPSVRRCVGDPPRQIEDPQSPPCVPYWSGDNGGSTSRGVTRDEVRIGITDWSDYYQPVVNFFNTRFEFYGRKLNVYEITTPNGNNDQQQIASAVEAETKNSFAAGQAYNAHVYHQELAKRRIVSVTREGTFTQDAHRRLRPYTWSYMMSVDKELTALGNWTCTRLAHRPARFGGPDVASRTRVFGLIFKEIYDGASEGANGLRRELEQCNSKLAAQASFPNQAGFESFQNAVVKMKESGVTSIYVIAQAATSSMAAAIGQNYYPEWMMTSYIQDDYSWWSRSQPSSQMAHAFGLTFRPRERPAQESPSRWAWNEATGSAPRTPDAVFMTEDNIDYRTLLVLASGIQMAGPRLTPETFEAGLHAARFPNPPHALMAGAVGFNDGDHSMTDDAAEMWWSNDEFGVYDGDGKGTWCVAEGGARRRNGTWATTEPAIFTGACNE